MAATRSTMCQPAPDLLDPEHGDVRGADAGRRPRYGLAEEIVVDGDGRVHAPEGAGLGAAIDFDLIRAKTISVLS